MPASSDDLGDRRIGWLLVAYFFVRIPLVALVSRQGPNLPASYQYVEFLLYALTAAMLVVARSSLSEYRIDRLTVVIFVLFGTLLRIPSATEDGSPIDPMYYAFGPVALVLLAVILRSRSAVNRWARASWEWIPLGLLSGVGPILLAAVVRMLVSGDSSPIGGALPLSTVGLVFMFLYQMGNSAIIEEPAFRGFLWGHLEQRGWSGVRIWFFQAALFWLAHVRYIDRPFTLWVTVPVGGLLFGWISWKSRSVGPALLAHAAYNSLAAFD